MPRKRQREEQPQPEREEAVGANEQPQEGAAARREGMASVARRRAAHFAHFDDDDDGDAGEKNIHVGSDQARTLGPWSSAYELVNAREKAQMDRQAKLKEAAAEEQQAPDDAAAWEPSRDPRLGPHPRDAVQPLFGRCLEVLTEYIDCVESLVGVPDAIKVRLAADVCARRKMSPEAARIFATSVPTEVLLPDCTQLDSAAMGELLKEVAGSRLQRLELGFCGRGFGDEAAGLLAACGPLEGLEVLLLEGAYRLSDAGLERGSRLTGALLHKLPSLTANLSHLNLADCRGIGGDSLVAALPSLANLRSLKLDCIPEVDDGVLAALGSLTGLRELSIRCCQSFPHFPVQAVTDAGLTALAATRGSGLEVLRLDECGGKVTDKGLAALASQCKALRVFSARRCTRLGDEALAELLRGGCMQHLTLSGVPGVGPAVASVLASCCKDLEHLDISFCRKLPDSSLGLLLERCTRLRRLVVFGCSQLTPRSLYGHTNADLSLEGVHTKVDMDLRTGAYPGGGSGAAGQGRAGAGAAQAGTAGEEAGEGAEGGE
ncbi:hypothetical protein GPECTOR_75g757 [Gonium pectorale]|uniref:F-box/LRR-repeat protein 15-like leucin rich repeat domain-containing protein n=1 Tax=Gonium pectorale TaxID=33097 RepID=A0A150G2I4_GONPE|nr:hypothetical protein GPECTOR_75g757 [Gonium pectorale]|eukprot:KXZ44033.1 hypothetical protein GPECTOR_75g757 [Gonium pectorale]